MSRSTKHRYSAWLDTVRIAVGILMAVYYAPVAVMLTIDRWFTVLDLWSAATIVLLNVTYWLYAIGRIRARARHNSTHGSGPFDIDDDDNDGEPRVAAGYSWVGVQQPRPAPQ